jgi:hypothetical protein
MLAALLQNNNNARVEERPPTIHVDRGGGGPLWGPRYDIVDIASAVAAFPEVAGEDSVARAARRTRWIGHALPLIKEAREKREAAAFLAGVSVAAAADGASAAAQPISSSSIELDAGKIEQLVAIIEAVRAESTPSPPAPSAHSRTTARGSSGGGLFVGGLIVGGFLAALLLRRR